jgi:hypothetical protein
VYECQGFFHIKRNIRQGHTRTSIKRWEYSWKLLLFEKFIIDIDSIVYIQFHRMCVVGKNLHFSLVFKVKSKEKKVLMFAVKLKRIRFSDFLSTFSSSFCCFWTLTCAEQKYMYIQVKCVVTCRKKFHCSHSQCVEHTFLVSEGKSRKKMCFMQYQIAGKCNYF